MRFRPGQLPAEERFRWPAAKERFRWPAAEQRFRCPDADERFRWPVAESALPTCGRLGRLIILVHEYLSTSPRER
jgi:hypothetical protein